MPLSNRARTQRAWATAIFGHQWTLPRRPMGTRIG